MTLNSVLLVLLLFAHQESSPVAGFSSYIDHQRYEFSVSQSALSDSPSWSDTEAFPPLSPRTAIAAAWEQLKALGKNPNGWRMNNISLAPIGQEGKWVYLVELEEPPPRPDGGIHGSMKIVVLMDGKTVSPSVTPWP